MKKTLYKISILLHFLIFNFNLGAQVDIKLEYNCFQNKNVFYSIYTLDGISIFEQKKTGSITLPFEPFQSSILVVFSSETQPDLFYVETTDRTVVKNHLKLKGKCKTKSKKAFALPGPNQHYKIKNGHVKANKFDLDNIKDKTGFGGLMGIIREDLKSFYNTNVLPLEQEGFHKEENQSDKSKKQYVIGSTIYELSKKKKTIEAQIKKQESNRRDDLSKIELCQFQYKLIDSEYNLAKIKRDIQYLKWKKAKQKYINGKVKSPRYFHQEALALEQEEKSTEIAALNLENKSFELAIFNTKAINGIDTSLITLRLMDIQIQKQKRNTHRIYEMHNELATNSVGRDRLVELANAAQMIAQEVQLDYDQYQNVLKRWEIMDGGTGKFKKQIETAKKTLVVKWENTWQADMAYLEHMWHLRDKPSVKSKFDDIMRHQNDLLVGGLIDRGQLAELDPNDKKMLDKKTKLAEVHKKAHYQVKIDDKGRKSYIKNGRPISKLTYQFETKRLFGEITEETLTETQKKTLWAWFNSVILLN